MANPTIVDIPHRLGREEARRRLNDNIGDMARHIPVAIGELHTGWSGPDRMTIELTAMGQRVTATLDIEDALVRVSFVLPGLLGFMGGAIAAAVRREGSQLLLPGKG